MFDLTEYERGLSRAADIADGHAKMNRDSGNVGGGIAASSVAAFIEQAMIESFKARSVSDEDVSAFLRARHVRWYGETQP